MPISINGRTYMNLQEAVAWLLANNALPFQCRTNFVADTEISKTDIINPAPAELKVGSLVLFADGIVGTVNGITANGFRVGSEATDLSDGVPHITDIDLDASNHLIFIMSEGDPIDAGLIKEISSMNIDASQHLIVNYNDGTSNDLGAIFQGNVNIAGNLTADSIVENMSGYTFTKDPYLSNEFNILYAGVVKNGNKVTLAVFMSVTLTAPSTSGVVIGTFTVPQAVADKLYPFQFGGVGSNYLDVKSISAASAGDTTVSVTTRFIKNNQNLTLNLLKTNLLANTEYFMRYEVTFLLGDNLAS